MFLHHSEITKADIFILIILLLVFLLYYQIMLQEKKSNIPSSQFSKLPSVHKLPSQHLLTKHQIQYFLTQSSVPNINFYSHNPNFDPLHFKRYESKQNSINRFRAIAKSNYIKNVTQKAAEQLLRSRVESINILQKKISDHKKHQRMIETDVKKEQNMRKELEKQGIRGRKKKIDEMDRLEKMRKEKQMVQDRGVRLENTLKQYQEYERFCVEVIGNQLLRKDIDVIKADVMRQKISCLQQNCIKEFQSIKTINDQLKITKAKLLNLKKRFESTKQSYQIKIKHLISSIDAIFLQITHYKNHLKIIQYDRNKRGSFSIISSMASKFLKNKSQVDFDEENVFMDILSKMEIQLDKYKVEIEQNKNADLARYNKKQYEYLIGKFHPSRATTNQDKHRRF